ncbi:MAG: hypothetical protein KJ760_20205, partial [Proteobacteria bacterium]|nr:hypothetical protein [Pseudomonadota bacterium]
PPDILVLSWDCSDPENNPLTFDIYLDIVSPPLFKLASSNTTKSYVVNNLGWKTNHYWKVVAKDDQGNTTSGPVWKFTTIGKKPESPTLSSPSNGATNISLPPTLSWNSSSGATSYTLQVAKDDQFTSSSLVYDQNVGNKTTQQVTGLSNSTPYYWRVNAENSNGISGWSAVWNFTTVSLTNNPPNAPTSPSPADGVTDQSTSPTLSWQCSDPDGDPLTYDVYFGTSDPPTATIATDQTATSISRSGLTSNTKYYWKIVAKDNKGASTTGNVWNFTTITAATAPTVTTTSITGITSTTATGGGNVTSQGSASVTARGVCWSTSQNPTTADSKTVDGSGTGSFTSSITGLTASTTYYVRAYAINSAGTSYGSQLSFVTTTGGTAPATPTLSFPTNGAINQSINPTLSWNASSGATSYILQVSNSTSFASPFYNQDVGNVTSKQISGLSVTTQYWWRVIAKNSVGESSPSGAWSFTTASSGGSSCAGTPTVTYAGKTYNTVQIGAQCWLKENLDVGTRINGSQNSGNNSIIEKYCYNDDPNNCDTYGGLYQWDEAMQYVTTERAKGICPTGWHIPTYAELQTLGTTVSNDGNALKAIGQGTGSGAGTNTSGFSALLAGYRYYGGYFYNLGNYAIFWSSTENEASGADALGLSLTNYGSNIYFHYYGKGYGYS